MRRGRGRDEGQGREWGGEERGRKVKVKKEEGLEREKGKRREMRKGGQGL